MNHFEPEPKSPRLSLKSLSAQIEELRSLCEATADQTADLDAELNTRLDALRSNFETALTQTIAELKSLRLHNSNIPVRISELKSRVEELAATNLYYRSFAWLYGIGFTAVVLLNLFAGA